MGRRPRGLVWIRPTLPARIGHSSNQLRPRIPTQHMRRHHGTLIPLGRLRHHRRITIREVMSTTEPCLIRLMLRPHTRVTLHTPVTTHPFVNSDIMLQIRATRDVVVRRRPRAHPMQVISLTPAGDISIAPMGIIPLHMLATLLIMRSVIQIAMEP